MMVFSRKQECFIRKYPSIRHYGNVRNVSGSKIGVAFGIVSLLGGSGFYLWQNGKNPYEPEPILDELLLKEKRAEGHGTSTSDWKKTLNRVVPAIVSLKLNHPRSFDTESPRNGWATGFVVDAEKGIILTNRHVIGPGPIEAEAIFNNNEEVRVFPIYRDPVHDFGFFRYDPKDVRHLSVPTLPLKPEYACVGTDIRVVGNDAVEKLSIASGTLARLDRVAPNYGVEKYNDFNTFYFQASSGTTGGSSGSPVLNDRGEVIALNAGGKQGSSASFFLPLNRVKRALELIRNGKPVPRGSIQTVFIHRPFDELRRLGINPETESCVRENFKSGYGLLVVLETVTGGPAHGVLLPGDILVRVNKKLVADFVSLETILDDNVGKELEVEIERAGKKLIKKVTTQDLHDITPSKYLEFGGAIFNPLSYQQAKNQGLECGLPYVADPGYFLERTKISRGSIITAVDGIKMRTFDDLKNYLEGCHDGQRVVIHQKDVTNGKLERIDIARVNRKWFQCQECTRNDVSGLWDCIKLHEHDKPTPEHSEAVNRISLLEGKNPIEKKLAKSMVMVEFDRPFCINSLTSSIFGGTGLILDSTEGLVVVDRSTVPDSLGDVQITFANTLTVPGRVTFIHPVHNFAILRYDPKSIGDTPVESCKVSSEKAKPADKAWLVGLTTGHGQNSYAELVSRETLISGSKWIRLPPPHPPRYQEHNIELLGLQDGINSEGGAVCNEDGEILAFWGSFSYQQRDKNQKTEASFMRGIPIEMIMETLDFLKKKNAKLYDLAVDFEHISLATSRQLGMSQALAEELEKHSAERRTVLSVMRRWGGSDAQKKTSKWRHASQN